MYFGEPLTDFRTHLYTDDGQSVEITFNVNASRWRLATSKALSRDTVRQMIAYLHSQFYPGEDGFLRDWLSVADRADLEEGITLKTVDRL